MNIGFVVTELLDGRFLPWEKSLDWESYLDLYCLALRRRGHQCVKYVPSIGVSKTKSYLHKFGHVVKRVPAYKRVLAPRTLLRPKKYEAGYTTTLRPLLGPSFTLNLIKEASIDGIDVLHYSSYYSLFFVPSFVAAHRFATVAQYTGGSLPSGSFAKPLWKLALGPGFGATRAILVGDYKSEVRALTNYLGVRPDKLRNFDAPIIDQDVFHELDKSKSQRELGMDPGKKNLLSVTFIPRRHSIGLAKDPFLMVEIFAEAVRQGMGDSLLHIVGWGPGEEDLRQYVVDNGLSDLVKVYGHIPHPRLPSYFSATDLFFLPYPLERLNEGSVTIEAFACSRPVVAFKRNPTDETEQYGGFLVETDPKSGGTTLLEYARNSDFLERKGREGRAFSAGFTLEYAGLRLEEVYREIIKK
ncbi:MAG: glycosyltransferase family 4 protein [Thaumarchaeota archaeon]|nr:glycosyltransferase family 4 protein [Nitrososphaerota archaeon]